LAAEALNIAMSLSEFSHVVALNAGVF